ALHRLRAQPLARSGVELLQRLGALALRLVRWTPLGRDQRCLVSDERPEARPHPAAVHLELIWQLDACPGPDPQSTPGKVLSLAHLHQRPERRRGAVERGPTPEP